MTIKTLIVSGAAAATLGLTLSTSSLSPLPALYADSLACNLSQYKPAQGLTAAIEKDTLVVSWAGQNGADTARAIRN